MDLTRLTILTAILMIAAAASVLFSSNGSGSDEQAPAVQQTFVDGALDRQITDLQTRSASNPGDTAALTQLGFAYLQKSRENGDPSYYTRADGVFQQALTIGPDDPVVLTGLGAVALARHDFDQALALADQAIQLDPVDADSHAVAGDALIELGRYDEAIGAFQQVVDLRPDLGAYVRIAYAREVRGDVDGARQALEAAIEAAGPRGENAAYANVQLGNLLFSTGDLDGAEMRYRAALDAFPGYVHALAYLARVHAARGEYDEAISLYSKVTARLPALEYVVAFGDTYAAAGDANAAAQQYALVDAIDQLYRANGVNIDLELALFYADHDRRLDDAVRQAYDAYEKRPGIRAADALAWALYKAGQAEEALPYSELAIAQGTQEASFFYHLGMVQKTLGMDDAARESLAYAIAINPDFSLLQAPIAEQALEELGR